MEPWLHVYYFGNNFNAAIYLIVDGHDFEFHPHVIIICPMRKLSFISCKISLKTINVFI